MNNQNRGSQTCAECRHHRRRRCHANCQFGAFFPAERFDEFQNAYRLFGVSNIMKIMESVEPEQRRDCAESILAEANIWRNNPAHGCLGYVNNLLSQIHSKEWEKATVNQQLAFFRGMESSSSLSLIPSQSGFDSQRPSSKEMPSEHMDEEHYKGESVQSFKQEGESSGVSKADDKGKKIAEEKDTKAKTNTDVE